MTFSEPHKRALLFDMDGVLTDSEPLWRRAEIEIMGDVGLRLTERDCKRTQGLRIDEAVVYWFARARWAGRSCEDVARGIVDRAAEPIGNEGKPRRSALHDRNKTAGIPGDARRSFECVGSRRRYEP